MKRTLLAVAAALFSGCYAHAYHHHPVYVGPAVGVAVATPPPVTQVEVVESAPSAEVVWVPGYWHWGGVSYVWIPGRYVDARPGYVWVAPRYTYSGGSYLYVHGYWGPRHSHHGPRYYGRPHYRGHSYGGHRHHRGHARPHGHRR